MTVWDPFRELETLRQELDRAVEGLGLRNWPNYWRGAFLPARGARVYPLLNLSEDKDTLYVEALAPGLEPESLELTVAGNQLTIAGQKPAVNGNVQAEMFHRSERGAGRFVRTIELPVGIEEQNVKADYKQGLLLITLPKAEAAKPKQISVSVT